MRFSLNMSRKSRNDNGLRQQITRLEQRCTQQEATIQAQKETIASLETEHADTFSHLQKAEIFIYELDKDNTRLKMELRDSHPRNDAQTQTQGTKLNFSPIHVESIPPTLKPALKPNPTHIEEVKPVHNINTISTCTTNPEPTPADLPISYGPHIPCLTKEEILELAEGGIEFRYLRLLNDRREEEESRLKQLIPQQLNTINSDPNPQAQPTHNPECFPQPKSKPTPNQKSNSNPKGPYIPPHKRPRHFHPDEVNYLHANGKRFKYTPLTPVKPSRHPNSRRNKPHVYRTTHPDINTASHILGSAIGAIIKLLIPSY